MSYIDACAPSKIIFLLINCKVQLYLCLGQILTSLDVIIPLPVLLPMLRDGVQAMADSKRLQGSDVASSFIPVQTVAPAEVAFDHVATASPLSPGNVYVGAADEPRVFTFDVPQPMDEEYKNVACFIMMLDIVLKQVRPSCSNSYSTGATKLQHT